MSRSRRLFLVVVATLLLAGVALGLALHLPVPLIGLAVLLVSALSAYIVTGGTRGGLEASTAEDPLGETGQGEQPSGTVVQDDIPVIRWHEQRKTAEEVEGDPEAALGDVFVWRFTLMQSKEQTLLRVTCQPSAAETVDEALDEVDVVSPVPYTGEARVAVVTAPPEGSETMTPNDVITMTALHCIFTGDLTSLATFTQSFALELGEVRYPVGADLVKLVIVVGALTTGNPMVVHTALTSIMEDVVAYPLDEFFVGDSGRRPEAEDGVDPDDDVVIVRDWDTSPDPHSLPIGPKGPLSDLPVGVDPRVLAAVLHEADPVPSSDSVPRRPRLTGRDLPPFPGAPIRPRPGIEPQKPSGPEGPSPSGPLR